MQRYGEILKRNWPIAAVAVFLLVFMAWRNAAPPVKYPIPEKSAQVEMKSTAIAAKSTLQGLAEDSVDSTPSQTQDHVIYITGAVQNPGIQKVTAGTRLYEVVEKAGGFLPLADKDRINLAAKVEDGVHYSIPEKGQEIVPDIQPLLMPGSGGRTATTDSSGNERININQADKAALMELDGIGETLAKRILEYREKNGPFSSPEELLQVSGIGDKKFEAIRDKITAP